jgi:type IV fimbrial biogenesis protein FimT
MRIRVAGFSMVEALVAITIVAILFAVALPSFQSMLQGIQVKTAAEALNNGMQLAKAEAVRRNTNVTFTLGTGTAWTVGCAIPIADSNADGVDECPATIQSRPNEVNSQNVAVAVTPAGATTVTFSGLGRAVTTANPITQLGVTATGTNRSLQIMISGGRIRMCDPTIVSSENARKC